MSQETEKLDLSALEAKAAAVAAQHDETSAAIAEERAARAALLERVIAIVSPSLRALSSRIQISYRSSGLATNGQRSSTEYLDVPGIYLSDDESGPVRDAPRDNDGAFEGTDFFLLSDGRIADLTYSGSWSKWQGSSTEWEAKIEYVTAADLVRYDRDRGAIAALTAALDAHLSGKSAERAKAARERAARLRAIATLS